MVTNLTKNNAVVSRKDKGGFVMWGDLEKTWGDSVGTWGAPYNPVTNQGKHTAIITNKPKS